ncbi:SMP-30/gluconolactonase/LRE family protein [Shouchella shacheensis]|uniref:SMP-30/gluconolactonase/LRE family protein n=1 Tax=Shouchella shacheensis TaxID=1649580 RepID=UPI000740370F|nr:SMP-30/gluconolactonase/LRE family protein [Shouchella shacheensis]
MEAKLEFQYQGQLLEGPFWDDELERLLFVDILGKKLVDYRPSDQTLDAHSFPSHVTAVVKATETNLLLSTRDQLIFYHEPSGTSEALRSFSHLGQSMRLNDGKCDPFHRFWVGTMSEDGSTGTASLYVADVDGEMKKAKEGVTISNGLAWNQAADTMYFIDTPTNQIMAYPFSKETTELKDGQVVIDLHDIAGSPDGMTIDVDDRLWVALWGGSRVICVDPQLGKIVDSIALPVSNVTSCTFGGVDRQTLYITTAREGVTQDQLELEPLAGSLFSCTMPTRGAASLPCLYP